jgi:hypothetical protein
MSVIGEVARTEAQQFLYVKEGRSQTMKSNHLRKLAADLDFFIVPVKNLSKVWVNGLDGDRVIEILKPLGIFWESLHPKNRWGGNFDRDYSRKDPFIDAPHFERNI